MADEDLEEQVTCWVCFEVMEDPTTLACSHSFCKDCLVKVYKRDPNCPFCRRPFGLPLPDPDRTILELIERIKGPKAAPSNAVERIEIEQNSALLDLPAEVTGHIFDFLAPHQLVGAGLVCRMFHQFADDPWVWRTMCMDAFPFVGGADNNDWKRIYLRRSKLKKGWEGGKSGDFTVTSMRGHDGYITSIDILKNQAITGGSTGQIKVWRTNTSKLAYECTGGHTSAVTSVKFNDIYIISGGMDRTVRLWDTQTGSLLRTMDTIDYPVSSVSFDGDSIISCAHSVVDVHDIRSARRTAHLTGGGIAQRALFLDDGKFIIARSDGVSVVDGRMNADPQAPPNPNQNANAPVTVHTLQRPIDHMEMAGPDLVALSSGQDLVLWNFKTGGVPTWTCRLPTPAPISVFKADSNRVVAGTSDGHLIVARHRNPALRSIVAHVGSNAASTGVNDLQFDTQRIVTAGADNSIKVWDIASGKALYTLLGGSLQIRGSAKPHPTKPGCSYLVYDENRIVGSFANVLKSFNFSND